jgi:hypothetical protein
MSMDDVMTALRVFQRELDHFTSTMQSSVTALEREHSQVESLWQDTFSKEYHRRWNAFADNMAQYLKRDAPKYKSFLASKIQQLGRYLGHG